MSAPRAAEKEQIARALHDHGLCVEMPGDGEAAHAEGRAACHRFAQAVLAVIPTGEVFPVPCCHGPVHNETCPRFPTGSPGDPA